MLVLRCRQGLRLSWVYYLWWKTNSLMNATRYSFLVQSRGRLQLRMVIGGNIHILAIQPPDMCPATLHRMDRTAIALTCLKLTRSASLTSSLDIMNTLLQVLIRVLTILIPYRRISGVIVLKTPSWTTIHIMTSKLLAKCERRKRQMCCLPSGLTEGAERMLSLVDSMHSRKTTLQLKKQEGWMSIH